MATTRIIPLHAGKGRTVGKAISDIIDYVKNPEKTDHGRLITNYQCDSRVADAQFLLDKQTYACLLYTSRRNNRKCCPAMWAGAAWRTPLTRTNPRGPLSMRS